MLALGWLAGAVLALGKLASAVLAHKEQEFMVQRSSLL